MSFELIIRKNAKIKSRQWWNKRLLKFKSIVQIVLSKKVKKLIKSSSCSILITNNKEIQKLNKKFRKINKPTDVLSFPQERIKNRIKKYLGDIVISTEKAMSQAKESKVLLEDEFIMLFVHGFLHLLGYDHKIKREAKIMFSLQNKITKKMKIKNK